MTPIWIASMILQWVLIVALSILVLSLIRQLGSLTLQLNALSESNARDTLAPYSPLPSQEATLVDGRQFLFGGTRERPCLLVFFSPTCSACQGLPSAIRALVQSHPPSELDVLVVLSLERAAAQNYLAGQSFGSIAVALQEDFPQHYITKRGVPFALGLTMDGIVAARGKPKNLDHLSEMAQAAQRMADVATNHSLRKHEWGESAPYWDFDSNSGPAKAPDRNVMAVGES